jgi:hypothetical protein
MSYRDYACLGAVPERRWIDMGELLSYLIVLGGPETAARPQPPQSSFSSLSSGHNPQPPSVSRLPLRTSG